MATSTTVTFEWGRRPARQASPSLTFDQRLVLNQWILSLFEVTGFDQIASDVLKDPRQEGWDEDNVSHFHHVLTAQLFQSKGLPAGVLLDYDQNVTRHWQRIAERRSRDGHALYPKYFQYLALLFAEIYLDRYFRDPAALLSDLNAHVAAFNAGKAPGDRVEPYEIGQLNKLAFWNATGSGKTLLMHVNVLQYRHYLEQHGRERDLNRVILLTPNEGLSRQHLDELNRSGPQAELFVKDGGRLFAGQSVEIIDINKLRDTMGEKTVAIDAFEGNNLVLVDEGHRGSSGVEWKAKRDQLCERGFSFEYSATFGQAMKAANKPALTQEYTKCILFDYSYKYFYRDGYGKDYQILNLEDDSQEEIRQLYLTACLLVFYQQCRLFLDRRDALRPFMIENPLLVFVGYSVNAVRTDEGARSPTSSTSCSFWLASSVGSPRR
ncbi:MAG: DEAD/DEAH box helicase family protein [Chloroflexota bacterium]